MNKLPTLYYISHGASPEDHLIGIEKVCIAGCKIVQLRLKSTSSKIVEKTAEKAQAICKKYNAQLVINDYTDTAEKTVGTGLHLGKK